jgi:hypothetical protein
MTHHSTVALPGNPDMSQYCNVLEGSIHDGSLLHSKIQHTAGNYKQ